MKRHVLSLSLCSNPDGKNTITKKQNHCQSYLLLKAKGSTKPRNLNEETFSMKNYKECYVYLFKNGLSDRFYCC